VSSLDSFFANVTLPSMPEVAHALITTLNDDVATIPQLRNILGSDPALSAKLLRLANSAQMGLPRGVATLDDAINMVGMTKVRTLALGACLNNAFPVMPGLDRNAFWKSCMRCAGYSQWMSSHLGFDMQISWLTGLMLRLGELLIGQAEPKALVQIEALPHIPCGRWAREKRIVGFTEGEVTAELARRWNFPMLMVRALQNSAAPMREQAFSRLGGIVHLAALLADSDNPGPQTLDELPLDVVGALSLDMQWLRENFPSADNFIDVS
jgi:HD-like signal output (HDOD) protein